MLPIAQLPAANSLNMTVQQFGAIVGPLLAGVLLRWIDLSTLYLLDAITCLAPIWVTFRLARMPVTESSAAEGSSRWGWGGAGGLPLSGGNQVVLMSFVVDLIAMIFGMPRALFPQMAHELRRPGDRRHHHGAARRGDVGRAVAGGVLSGWFPRIRRQGLAVIAAIVVWGLAMVGFSAARRCGGRPGRPDAVGCARVPRRRRWRRHGLRGVPVDDPAGGRLRRSARPFAGVFLVVVAGGPRLADTVHGAAAAVIGTTVAAAGGSPGRGRGARRRPAGAGVRALPRPGCAPQHDRSDHPEK